MQIAPVDAVHEPRPRRPLRTVLSLWKGEITVRPGGRALMRLIVEETADSHQMSVRELMGPERVRRVAWARQEAMSAIYATRRFSYPQVGRFFGRDHTTVIFAVRAVERRALAEQEAA